MKSNQEWDRYLYGFAVQAAQKSKDSTQVGAALIMDYQVRATGYNGPPRGVEDTPERRERPAKYLFAAHAEENLIYTCAEAGIPTKGCKVFVTHMPCNRCAIALIQSGIKYVVYGPGKTSMPQEQFDAAEAMFREANVTCEPMDFK